MLNTNAKHETSLQHGTQKLSRKSFDLRALGSDSSFQIALATRVEEPIVYFASSWYLTRTSLAASSLILSADILSKSSKAAVGWIVQVPQNT